MGYRAHIITQHREYGGEFGLNWQQLSDYYDDLDERYGDKQDLTLMRDEEESYYEIDNIIAKYEIRRLTELGLEEKFEFSDDTNGDIIEYLQSALKETKETYIALELF